MINDNAPRHTLRTVNNCMKKEQKNNICSELKQRPRRRRRRRQRERQKSIFNWFRLTKQQLCTCITLFCTFLCRHCTTTTWNFIFSRFVEDVNTGQKFSFSFPELWYSPLDPEKYAIICRIKRDEINAIKFEAAWVYFSNDGFVAVAVVVA